MSKDSLGDRMKTYEAVPAGRLVRKIPVIIRVDGKAFHTFTRGMTKPYCRPLAECMWAAAQLMCKEIQGAKLAYVQSDEISVLVTDYSSLEAEAWFDYQIQKMASVAAAFATIGFYKQFLVNFPGLDKTPVFDARVYNVPMHDVNNYFLWRQNDATRNSISGLAQANFSSKRLHGVTCDQMQELLFQEKQINWNDCPVEQKRGVCLRRVVREIQAINGATGEETRTTRSSWEVDLDIPIFSQNRNYVQRFVDPPADPKSSVSRLDELMAVLTMKPDVVIPRELTQSDVDALMSDD